MTTTPSATTRLDPVTVEVLRNALPAIANEMSNAMQRAAYSSFIYEVKDFCLGIYDPEGRMWCQGIGGVAMFLADLGLVPKDGVRHFGGVETFHPGDVMLHNHQRLQGSHLNHMNVYTPFFWEGELICFPTVRAHHQDIGGAAAGGITLDPWMEGFQIDHLKLYDRGVPNETAFQFIRDNVRIPHQTMGDLRAEVASCRLAERRLEEIFRRYGKDVVLGSVREIWRQAEAKARAVVEKIPDGVYTAESWYDHDRVDLDQMVPIKAVVTVKGSDMTIDLSETSKQRRGPINSRTFACPLIAYKAITTPLDHVSQGSFAALTAIIPEGSVMQATFPAPYNGWSSLLASVIDCIFAALNPVIPELPAGSQGTVAGSATTYFWTNPTTGRPGVFTSAEGAGWGASGRGDGVSGMCSITQGDVRNTPVEAIENKFPVRVDVRGLRQDSGGAGKFRGGLGLHLETYHLVPGYANKDSTGRQKFPPQGAMGGKPGAIKRVALRKHDEAEFKEYPWFRQQYVLAGSACLEQSTGGGGWGDPLERDPERVRMDVIDEYISFPKAAEEYGVALDPVSFEIDESATAKLRAERSTKR